MQAAAQEYEVMVIPTVIDKDGNIIKEYPKKNNLISDWGLDQLAEKTYVDLFKFCHIGTGTAPSNRGTELIQLNKVGDLVTANTSWFVNDDAVYRRVLQFGDNTTCRINTVNEVNNTATVYRVDGAENIANAAGLIWNTERKTLDNLYLTSNVLDTSVPTNNGSNSVVDPGYASVNMWRTFIFDFTSDTTITEAGWGFSDDHTDGLFGRIVLDTPISLIADQRLAIRIVFNRKVKVGPISSDPFWHAPATWEVGDDENTISSLGGKYVMNETGDRSVGTYRILPTVDPSSNVDIHVLIKHNNTSATENLAAIVLDKPDYVSGSYELVYAPTRNLVEFSRSVGAIWLSINSSISSSSKSNSLHRLVYDSPHTVAPGYLMEVSLRIHWRRTLPDFPIA